MSEPLKIKFFFQKDFIKISLKKFGGNSETSASKKQKFKNEKKFFRAKDQRKNFLADFKVAQNFGRNFWALWLTEAKVIQ